MIDCRIAPLVKWPQSPTVERRNGQFRIGYLKLIEELTDELSRLNASDVVLQMHMDEFLIRRSRRSGDGWPKFDSRPFSPGVILTFDGLYGAQYFACDTFSDWNDNLRAISLTLTSLRAIDRYGASRRGQQYKGYTALPAPPKMQAPMGDEEAGSLLASVLAPEWKPRILSSPDYFQRAAKMAINKTHPDKGGSHEDFLLIQQACQVLKVRHRL